MNPRWSCNRPLQSYHIIEAKKTEGCVDFSSFLSVHSLRRYALISLIGVCKSGEHAIMAHLEALVPLHSPPSAAFQPTLTAAAFQPSPRPGGTIVLPLAKDKNS